MAWPDKPIPKMSLGDQILLSTEEQVNNIGAHCAEQTTKGTQKYMQCMVDQPMYLAPIEEKTFLDKFLDPETGFKQFSRDLYGETIASWTTDGFADGVEGVSESVEKFKGGEYKAAAIGVVGSVARATPYGKVYSKVEGKVDMVSSVASGNVQVIGKAFSACGDREKYGKSKKKKLANNGKKGKDKIQFHRDHIPADSVMQARAKDIAKNKNMKVCAKAKTAIRDGATTTMLPDFIHIDGRTYGGKVKRHFEWDKNNLGAAAKDDIQAVKDATEKAYKKKKISVKCKDQIIAATEQMAKKSKAYTDMIDKALDLCD